MQTLSYIDPYFFIVYIFFISFRSFVNVDSTSVSILVGVPITQPKNMLQISIIELNLELNAKLRRIMVFNLVVGLKILGKIQARQ